MKKLICKLFGCREKIVNSGVVQIDPHNVYLKIHSKCKMCGLDRHKHFCRVGMESYDFVSSDEMNMQTVKQMFDFMRKGGL